MSLPKTCALPQQYREPQVEEFIVGSPFWEMATKYENFADVPVGTKGNDCLGCEPGSGPGPFIVVYNDNSKMGFIHPYVSVVGREEGKNSMMCVETCGSFLFTTQKQNNSPKTAKVTIQVGGDVDQQTGTDIRNTIASEYVITYFTYEEMRQLMKQMCCFNFGSFGNCALPNVKDEVTLDGYFLFS